MIVLTTFTRRTVAIGEQKPTSWSAWTRAVPRPRVATDKLALPLYSFVEFRENHRAKADVMRVFVPGWDVDVEPFTTIGALEALLAGYAATVHTSFSGAPHLRLHMLPSRPMTGDEHALVHRAVAEALREHGIGVGREAVDPSRAWFVPAHAPGAAYGYTVLEGRPLDVDAMVAAERERVAEEERQREKRRRYYERRAKRRAKETGADPDRQLLERAVARVSEATAVHSTLNRWTFILASKTRLADHEIETAMQSAGETAGLRRSEVARTIRGAMRSARRTAA